MKNTAIELFRTSDGKTELHVNLDNDTVWLSQLQMGELFGKSKKTISEHIFREEELQRSEATVRNFRTVQHEGGREIERWIECYSFEVDIPTVSAFFIQLL